MTTALSQLEVIWTSLAEAEDKGAISPEIIGIILKGDYDQNESLTVRSMYMSCLAKCCLLPATHHFPFQEAGILQKMLNLCIEQLAILRSQEGTDLMMNKFIISWMASKTEFYQQCFKCKTNIINDKLSRILYETFESAGIDEVGPIVLKIATQVVQATSAPYMSHSMLDYILGYFHGLNDDISSESTTKYTFACELISTNSKLFKASLHEKVYFNYLVLGVESPDFSFYGNYRGYEVLFNVSKENFDVVRDILLLAKDKLLSKEINERKDAVHFLGTMFTSEIRAARMKALTAPYIQRFLDENYLVAAESILHTPSLLMANHDLTNEVLNALRTSSEATESSTILFEVLNALEKLAQEWASFIFSEKIFWDILLKHATDFEPLIRRQALSVIAIAYSKLINENILLPDTRSQIKLARQAVLQSATWDETDKLFAKVFISKYIFPQTFEEENRLIYILKFLSEITSDELRSLSMLLSFENELRKVILESLNSKKEEEEKLKSFWNSLQLHLSLDKRARHGSYELLKLVLSSTNLRQKVRLILSPLGPQADRSRASSELLDLVQDESPAHVLRIILTHSAFIIDQEILNVVMRKVDEGLRDENMKKYIEEVFKLIEITAKIHPEFFHSQESLGRLFRFVRSWAPPIMRAISHVSKSLMDPSEQDAFLALAEEHRFLLLLEDFLKSGRPDVVKAALPLVCFKFLGYEKIIDCLLESLVKIHEFSWDETSLLAVKAVGQTAKCMLLSSHEECRELAWNFLEPEEGIKAFPNLLLCLQNEDEITIQLTWLIDIRNKIIPEYNGSMDKYKIYLTIGSAALKILNIYHNIAIKSVCLTYFAAMLHYTGNENGKEQFLRKILKYLSMKQLSHEFVGLFCFAGTSREKKLHKISYNLYENALKKISLRAELESGNGALMPIEIVLDSLTALAKAEVFGHWVTDQLLTSCISFSLKPLELKEDVSTYTQLLHESSQRQGIASYQEVAPLHSSIVQVIRQMKRLE